MLTAGIDLICAPFRPLGPIWALSCLSALTGIAMVWVFGRVSDQQGIRAVRERISGNLIGVRLYRQDLGVVLALQKRIFADTGRYLTKSLMPLAVVLGPMIVLMAQLNLRFAVRPLEVGETTLVKAYVRDAALLENPVTLTPSRGVTVETPAVRIRADREIVWRVRVLEAGRHEITVSAGDASTPMVVVAEGGWGSIPQRSSGPLFALLHPGATVISQDLPFEAVDVSYPAVDIAAFGLGFSWLVWFFVISIATGFLFKGVLGVEL